MAINEILWMTKPKLLVLIVLMLALIPKYYEFNCTPNACGFNFANFFTIFILSYIVACVIGEAYNFIRKKN